MEMCHVGRRKIRMKRTAGDKNMATCTLWFDELQNDEKIANILHKFAQFTGCEDTSIRTLDLRAHESKAKLSPGCHPIEVFADIYRMHCSQTPFCDSVYGLTDQLVSLQLITARRNKQEHGTFSADSEEVISLHQDLIKTKLGAPLNGGDKVPDDIVTAYNNFLRHCNALDYADLVAKVSKLFLDNHDVQKKYQESFQYAVIGTATSDVEVEMLKLLIGKQKLYKYCIVEGKDKWTEVMLNELLHHTPQLRNESTLLPATPMSRQNRGLNGSQITTPVHTQSPASSYMMGCCTPSTMSPLSQGFETKEQFASSVLLSYLQLLVNTRDEMALARIINIPDREIGPHHFTLIRKEAEEKRMTMFQTATSFILRIRLGGKGYAPADDSPLHFITKGLGEFVSFFQKLQNVLEDIQNPKAAITRILAILQSNLIKARDEMLRAEDVRKAVTTFKLQLEQLLDAPASEPQGTQPCYMVGVAAYKLIRGLLDINMLRGFNQPMVIKRELRTPRSVRGRAQSLLTKFRTPDPPSPTNDDSYRSRDEGRTQEDAKPKSKAKGSIYGDMTWAQPAIPTLNDKKQTDEYTVYIDTPIKNPCGIFRLDTPESRKRPREKLCEPDKDSTKSPLRKRPCESINDQENVLPSQDHDEVTKPPAKRGLLAPENASGKSKKVPKGPATKTKKSRGTKQIAGQKQLTHFFR